MLNQSLFFTALLAGVAGGSHCVGMCGGIASLLSGKRVRSPASIVVSKEVLPFLAEDFIPPANVIPIAVHQSPSSSALWHSALLHTGRLSVYALLGAIVGLFGTAGLVLKPIFPVHTFLFFIGNFSLIYLGFRCLGFAPELGLVSKVHQQLASCASRSALFISSIKLERYLPHFLNRSHRDISSAYRPRSPFVQGLIWGCMPCGLVYGVLPLALLSGAAWSGAILMLAFGIGALPYLLLTQGLAHRFGQRKAPHWLAIGAACMLIGIGAFGLFVPHNHSVSGWWC